MKQLIHLKSTIIPWVTGPIRYSPLARVFLLAAVLFACLPLSQTARAANPAVGTPAASASGGAINGFLNFSNTPFVGPEPTVTSFDAPGAGTDPGQGTQPFAINPAGLITGFYIDSGNALHGFLRDQNGAITTFDAPNAGTGPGQGTTPFSITPGGAIAGRYSDASSVFHGFLRTPDGVITTFDVPGAGTGPGQGTRAGNINPSKAIAGRYIDSNNVTHGFLRVRDGSITTFDAPGAGTGPGQGTIVFAVSCLNPAGAITATSVDASNVFHGVLRAPDGAMTVFDAPGAGTGPGQGTLTFGINQGGTIEGAYDDSSDVSHGFVRASDGTITTFDAPGAGTGPGQGTTPQNINAPGVVAGQYLGLE